MTIAAVAGSCGRNQPVAAQDVSAALPVAVEARVGSTREAKLALGRVSVRDRASPAAWQVEIAERPGDISHGLMFRRTLDSDRGMIFLMPKDNDWAFYMRNTYVALDMVFIDRNWRVVGVAANTRPLTETHHQSGRPCRYVLELAAHQARKTGIVVGTRLELQRLPAGPSEGSR